MPHIVETTVFQFEELDDAAKSRARDWYRELSVDDDWWDGVYNDFEAIAEIIGVNLRQHPVRLYGGGKRYESNIYFSGFWSQGDGACFEGTYEYRKHALKKIKEYAPQDTRLHDIAARLQDIQKKNGYQIHAAIGHRDRYYHAYTMTFDVTRESPAGRDLTADAEDIITEAMRDLANWLYRSLEKEYEYRRSDAVVDEDIIANEYTFTENGSHFG